MNGRFGGGGMALAPCSLMNDGLLDVSVFNKVIQAKDIPSIINQVIIQKGQHAYNEEWIHLRGNKIVLENLNYAPKTMNQFDILGTTPLKKVTQMFQVDGEGLTFEEKVTMDVCPEAI